MLAVPGVTPVTTPATASTVAIPVLPELHKPPLTASANVAEDATHTLPGPEIGATGLTVTTSVTWQLPITYVIAAVPADSPVTLPEASTVAIVPEVAQLPPVVTSLSAIEEPRQTADTPVIADGVKLTVIAVEYVQPVAVNVKLIVSAPGVMPVITPPVPAVATVALLLAQLPVPISESVVVAPSHRWVVPVIPDGKGFTVMVVTVLQPVPSVYVTKVEPGTTPVTTPLTEPTVAVEVPTLTHVPPAVVSASEAVDPTQTWVVPPIGPGNSFTVTAVTVVHPVGNV